MNYDRKKQEELLYNEKVRQANMQSDAIEMSNMIPLEKDYKYQMSLMKKQLQMILDDNRGSSDLDKQIAVLMQVVKALGLSPQELVRCTQKVKRSI